MLHYNHEFVEGIAFSAYRAMRGKQTSREEEVASAGPASASPLHRHAQTSVGRVSIAGEISSKEIHRLICLRFGGNTPQPALCRCEGICCVGVYGQRRRCPRGGPGVDLSY